MKKSAFTLAEVLITLTIIGVIAAITIPNLYSKYQKHVWVTQLRKAYSRINTINTLYVRENLERVHMDMSDSEIAVKKSVMREIIEQNGGSYCGNVFWNTSVKCNDGKTLKLDGYKNLNGSSINGESLSGIFCRAYDVFNFKDNMIICYRYASMPYGNVNWTYLSPGAYLTFLVDVNGSQGPNQEGRDVFHISQYQDKYIRPFNYNNTADCTPSGTGMSCAAKIINDGWKMNY